MTRIARSAGPLVLCALLGACSASPTAPAPQPATPAVSPSPAPALPPVAGTRVFVFTSAIPSSQTLTWYTPRSRYLLYEDGTFTLEYPHASYRGTYKQEGATITFYWEGWSLAGSWGAEGSLTNGQLSVRYNLIMRLSDFEDAAYALQPPSS